MTAPRRSAPLRVTVLFLAAMLGVLVVLGLVVAAIAGPVAVTSYAVVVLVMLVVGVARARKALRPPPVEHRACSCCSGGPFTGVEVV